MIPLSTKRCSPLHLLCYASFAVLLTAMDPVHQTHINPDHDPSNKSSLDQTQPPNTQTTQQQTSQPTPPEPHSPPGTIQPNESTSAVVHPFTKLLNMSPNRERGHHRSGKNPPSGSSNGSGSSTRKYYDPKSSAIPYSHTETAPERIRERITELDRDLADTSRRVNKLYQGIQKNNSSDKKKSSGGGSSKSKGTAAFHRDLNKIVDQTGPDLFK